MLNPSSRENSSVLTMEGTIVILKNCFTRKPAVYNAFVRVKTKLLEDRLELHVVAESDWSICQSCRVSDLDALGADVALQQSCP